MIFPLSFQSILWFDDFTFLRKQGEKPLRENEHSSSQNRDGFGPEKERIQNAEVNGQSSHKS
jgi:hypothetical protein